MPRVLLLCLPYAAVSSVVVVAGPQTIMEQLFKTQVCFLCI